MTNSKNMTNARKLRKVFEDQNFVVIPGAYDALSSLLVQDVGFPAVYMGGFSISAGFTGYPDWGFATMNEMLQPVVNAVNVLDVPVVCDIDQGFGALTNFVRTIQSYENAGVAADKPGWCLPVSTYEEMGFKGAIYCVLGLSSAVFQMKKNYETLFKTGHISSEHLKENHVSLGEINNLTKISQWQALRDKYGML